VAFGAALTLAVEVVLTLFTHGTGAVVARRKHKRGHKREHSA
jgi:hypothetical protein